MALVSMKIELNIIGARSIKAGDVTNTSDAYLKVKCNKDKYTTKVSKPTLNPFWEEKFTFTANVDDSIVFDLYDKDKFSKDDHLGRVVYSIKPIEFQDTIYELLPFDTKGVLYISLKCLEGGLPNQMKQYVNKQEPVFIKISNPKVVCYQYHCDFHSHNLRYKLGVKTDQTKETKSTPMSKLYGDSTDDIFIVESRVGEKIKFKLHYKELVGQAKKTTAEGKWKVPDLKDGETIHVNLKTNNYASFYFTLTCLRGVYHNVVPSLIPPPDDYEDPNTARYEIVALKGQNFARVDFGSQSDPFVSFKSCKSDKSKCTIAFNNDPSPKWDAALRLKCQPGETLYVGCYDHNFHTYSKCLGDGRLPIPIDMKEEEAREFTIPISMGRNCCVYVKLKRMRSISKTFKGYP